jgi:hypothetical protein
MSNYTESMDEKCLPEGRYIQNELSILQNMVTSLETRNATIQPKFQQDNFHLQNREEYINNVNILQ